MGGRRGKKSAFYRIFNMLSLSDINPDHMNRTTISNHKPQTLSWFRNHLIDWANIDVNIPGLPGIPVPRSLGYPFDAAITSEDGQYAFVYRRLGTKGVLMKHGEEIREINRPYYCSDIYEYPAAFAVLKGRTYLIHCPLQYRRLDFEDVETGEIVTDVPGRNADDVFHSRLSVSPGNRYLMSAGWFWHPWGIALAFDLEACLSNPLLLDRGFACSDLKSEIATASFIDDDTVLLGSSEQKIWQEREPGKLPPLHIAVWHLPSNNIIHVVKPKTEFGQLYAIDAERCFDTFRYPRIINLRNGEVEDKAEDIFSGLDNHAIVGDPEDYRLISFNRSTKQLAIVNKVTNSVEILSP